MRHLENQQVCQFTYFKMNLTRLYKTESYGPVHSDDILAYCLLKSANLSNNCE